MRICFTLSLAQLRQHWTRWALLAAGIALVAAVPIVTAGLSRSVSAQTVRRTVTQLDPAERTLLVSLDADSAEHRATPARNDTLVRAQLRRLTDTPALRELLYRQLAVDGETFQLGGVDDLGSAVRITSGRLPRQCTPVRCEVLVLDGADTAGLRRAAGRLGVVIVGTARRDNPLLVSGQLDVGGDILLADGADGIGALRALSLFGRHYAWVSELDADRVVSLGVNAYLARSDDVAAALGDGVDGTAFDRPDLPLQQAQQRADTSQRRLGLLGGFAAVLLLGFAVVAAVGLRREAAVLASALRRRGGSGAQVRAVAVGEVVLVAAAGLVLGALAGGLVAGLTSTGTDLSVGSAAGHALASAGVPVLVLTLLAAATSVAVLLWPDARAGAVWRLLDVVTVACLAAAVLAADRGSSTAGELHGSGDPLVIALPVLTAVVAGLVAARLWQPAARLAQRLLPGRSVAGRIALAGSIRRPLRAVTTVAFITAAIASVVFAGAYRATLLANDADQAAYRVPLDVTVAPSPADTVPTVPAIPGVSVHPVLRADAQVTQLAGVTDSVPVVATDRAAIAGMHRWQRTTGSSSTAAGIAQLLAARGAPQRPALPAGARTLSIAATGLDPRTAISLWTRGPGGAESLISLHPAAGRLVGTLPHSAGSAVSVAAIGVDQSFDYASRHAHATGEGRTDQPALAGTLHLGDVRVDGAMIPWTWRGWGSLLGTATPSGATLALHYALHAAPVIASPDFAAASNLSVPVVVDPQTAATARGGVLPLVLDSSTTVPGRIVGTLPRLPTAGRRFVLADRNVLAAALDLRTPGRNATTYWIAGSSTALSRYLDRTPASVVSRASVQARLDSDPVGRGARLLLVLVALVALAVAAVALVLLVVGERRDGAGELYSWEADGITPRTLRRVLAVRVGAVAAVALPVGVLAGAVLARLATALIAVDATGTTPTPPLAVTVGSVWTPLVLAVGIGAGLLVGGIVVLGSLRERLPVPAGADLR